MARTSGFDRGSTSHAVVEPGVLVSLQTASYAWLQVSTPLDREPIQEVRFALRALADNASTTRRDPYETTSRGPI